MSVLEPDECKPGVLKYACRGVDRSFDGLGGEDGGTLDLCGIILSVSRSRTAEGSGEDDTEDNTG